MVAAILSHLFETPAWFLFLLKTSICFYLQRQEHFYFFKNQNFEFSFLALQRFTHLPISVQKRC